MRRTHEPGTPPHGRGRDARAARRAWSPRAPRRWPAGSSRTSTCGGARDVLRRLDAARRAAPRLHAGPGRRGRRCGPAARWCSPRCRTCRSTPTAPRLYTPDELYDGLATGDYAGTLDARVYAWTRRTGHDLHAHARPGAARPRGRRRARRVGRRPAAGRRDGRARPGPRHRRLRRRGPARARAGPGRADRRDRWRPGRDGGREPRRLPVRPRRRRPARGARTCSPPCRGSSRRSATGRGRRSTYATRWPDGTGVAGGADLVLRARAAERVRRRGREVLQERDPRGRPAARLHRRDRVPAGARRHRAGGVPGRLRELLRRRRARWRRWCWSDGPTGPRSCRCGRCSQRLAAGREMAHALHLVDDLEEVAPLLAR